MELKSFVKEYDCFAEAAKVWQALTDPVVIERWGAGPDVVMSDKLGAEFKLWGGSIWGKNVEVIPKKKLVQEWYGGKWERPSLVTFELAEKNGNTHIKLTHKDAPAADADSFFAGWDEHYMEPLIELLTKGNS